MIKYLFCHYTHYSGGIQIYLKITKVCFATNYGWNKKCNCILQRLALYYSQLQFSIGIYELFCII